MNKVSVVASIVLLGLLGGCVSGAPALTPDQYTKFSKMSAYKPGETPPQAYKALGQVSGADCSGAPAGARLWGDAEEAVKVMKTKAAALNADAVINVTCGAAPLVNNCWAAKKCSGTAVAFQ